MLYVQQQMCSLHFISDWNLNQMSQYQFVMDSVMKTEPNFVLALSRG